MKIEYLYWKRNEFLYNDIKDRYKIYLDQNYWIDLLKFKEGHSVRKGIPELYSILEELKNKKKISIILSDIHISELAKQQNPHHLAKMISFMEEMTENVALIPEQHRKYAQILNALRILFEIDSSSALAYNFPYTTPAFIDAILFPNNLDYLELFKTDSDYSVHKSYLDHVWGFSLSKYVFQSKMLDILNMHIIEAEKSILAYLSAGKKEHLEVHGNISDLLKSEFYGYFGSYETYICQLLDSFYEDYQIGLSTIADQFIKFSSHERALRLMDTLLHTILDTKQYNVLPFVSITAGVHTLIRWDKPKDYAKNHFLDIMHAETAIPYSDYFFTDTEMGSLLNNKQLNIYSSFNCKIYSKPEKAINELSAL